MSGHNKWSKIKHVKARVDAKKGKAFTRCFREIVVAARSGSGDPAFNAMLRTAVDRAKACNMPAANIERAIKKGTGELDGEIYEEVIYEGYGPAGSAVLVRTLTDNRNRTVAELRSVFNKAGGTLGESGSVAWMFELKGVFHFSQLTQTEDELLELALGAGCEDISVEGTEAEAFCPPDEYGVVRQGWTNQGFNTSESGLEYVAKNLLEITAAEEEKVGRLLDQLDDQDDVQDVFCNIAFREEQD